MAQLFKYFLILLVCVQAMPARAQYYNLTFDKYTSSNGLSQSEVESILEDQYGFIWVGTRFGLTRFDGKEFRTFFHRMDDPGSMGENIVTDIEINSKGELWMGLYYSGISRMNPVNFRFENFKPQKNRKSLISNKVISLEIDRRDRVWVGTEEGLSIYDPATALFENPPSASSDGKRYHIVEITEAPDGMIWFGTLNHGMFYTSPDNVIMKPAGEGIIRGTVNDIHFENASKAWIASDSGLYIMERNVNDNSYTIKRSFIVISNESIKDIIIDRNGNVWMAKREHGLMIYFPKTGFLEKLQENFVSSRGLLSNRLTDVYMDSKGGIWLGGENGLQTFHFDSKRFNVYPGLSNVSNELKGASIYGIYETANDFILATSGGVQIYNRVTNRFIPVYEKHEAPDEAIRFRSLQREGQDKWWVCSDHGIFELTRKTGYYVLARPPELRDIQEMRQISFRNYLHVGEHELVMATTGEGLIMYNRKTGKLRRIRHNPDQPASLGNNAINNIVFDRDSNIVVCHDEGMSVFYQQKNSFRNFHPFEFNSTSGLSNRYVYDVYDDGKYYWVATYGGGLNKVYKSQDSVKYFTTRQGLCNDAVYTIVPQGDSVLWLSTNKGLSRFSIAHENFSNFNLEDGLPADEFNMLSEFVNSEGEIFMATINGVVSFHPELLTQSNFQPRIYLSKIRLNGQSLNDSLTGIINRDRVIRVKYNEDLFLEFTPLTYSGTEQISIRYRMNESGKWTEAQAGTLLPLVKTEPGTYNLGIQMVNNRGSLSSETWNLKLEVSPPFWRTPSFIVSAIALFLLLGFSLIRFYIRRRLEKQRIQFEKEQAVEKERARISSELHDDIGGGLTAIRLLSEMVKDKSSEELSRSYFHKISASSNELIQKMNEIVWALNVNHDNLQSLIAYTRQYAVSYLDDFQIKCNVQVPDQIPELPVVGNKRRNIFLLVKEALNNIAKHAQAETVDLVIRIGDWLHIEVSDNGKGINLDDIRAGSHGLANMRKRADYLNGRMDIVNKKGTTVIFEIPLKGLSDIPVA